LPHCFARLVVNAFDLPRSGNRTTVVLGSGHGFSGEQHYRNMAETLPAEVVEGEDQLRGLILYLVAGLPA
jgi:hypothetical protein